MTFRERLEEIDKELRSNPELRGLEPKTTAEPEQPLPAGAEQGPPVPTEQGAPVHCAECGANTFREEHSAIMCGTCGHGPFCNYCWNRHIQEFHPLLARPYEDARRGIRTRARFLNHYLIRTIVKPAGFAAGLIALLLTAYYSYLNDANDSPRASEGADSPAVVHEISTPAAVRESVAPAAGSDGAVPVPDRNTSVPDIAAARNPASATEDRNAPSAKRGNVSPAATAKGAADVLPLELLSLTSPAGRRSVARLEIQTAAGAACTIQVRYQSGPSKAAGLEPKTALSDGRVAWSWRIGNQTALGEWPVDIGCSLGSETAQLSATLAVAER